jgi:dTDP-4-amino-4,6-dideoxygalactose transaminase
MKKIGFVPHKRRIKKHKVEYLKAIAEVMEDPYQSEDGRDVRGVQLELANKCAELSGVPYWTFTNCCTDALQIAIHALTNPGDQILVSSYGWRAFANAVSFMQRQVRFADCDESGNMDLDSVAEGLQNNRWGKLGAIIVVQNFGTVCDVRKIKPICDELNITVIEDAAPAFQMGESYDYKPGHASDVVCFSFDFTKCPATLGSGGGMAVHTPELHNLIYEISAHGRAKDTTIVRTGTKSYLDVTSCAVLLKDIELYEQHNYRERRRQVASFYLDNLPYACVPGDNFIWERYTMNVPHKEVEKVIEKLNTVGCLSKTFFKEPLHLFPWLNTYQDKCPKVESFVDNTVMLPSHHFLEDEELELIADVLS